MRFEWDPAKAKANIARHGVSFEAAQAVFTDLYAIERLDESTEEERWHLLGRAGSEILMVVYTERVDRVRIISVRKASEREQEVYLKQDQSD
jgi:uncharacterized DUF497 family protein